MNDKDQIREELSVDPKAFRTMFKDHGAIMYIVELETFAIIDANKAALEFYGYDLETMRKINEQEVGTGI